jgi:hypothetical protein
MSVPKRHHFLPQTYLNGFCAEGYLCVFDRIKREYRWQQPAQTAVISHYYTTTNAKDEKDYEIEHILATIEGRTTPVIAKLNRGETITPQERFFLAQFLAFLATRTPKFEREITEIADRVHKIIAKEIIRDEASAAELLRQHGSGRDITPESMLAFVQEERFEMVGTRNIAIRTMLDQTLKITRDLFLMDWCIAHCASFEFVTTDAPLGFILSDEQKRSAKPILGLASPEITKIIPLTHRTCLLIGAYGGRLGHFEVSDFQTRELNVAVAKESERFVIGRTRVAVRHAVRKSRIHVGNPGTRLKIENIPHPNDPQRSFMVARRVSPEQPNLPLKIALP